MHRVLSVWGRIGAGSGLRRELGEHAALVVACRREDDRPGRVVEEGAEGEEGGEVGAEEGDGDLVAGRCGGEDAVGDGWVGGEEDVYWGPEADLVDDAKEPFGVARGRGEGDLLRGVPAEVVEDVEGDRVEAGTLADAERVLQDDRERRGRLDDGVEGRWGLRWGRLVRRWCRLL